MLHKRHNIIPSEKDKSVSAESKEIKQVQEEIEEEDEMFEEQIIDYCEEEPVYYEAIEICLKNGLEDLAR